MTTTARPPGEIESPDEGSGVIGIREGFRDGVDHIRAILGSPAFSSVVTVSVQRAGPPLGEGITGWAATITDFLESSDLENDNAKGWFAGTRESLSQRAPSCATRGGPLRNSPRRPPSDSSGDQRIGARKGFTCGNRP